MNASNELEDEDAILRIRLKNLEEEVSGLRCSLQCLGFSALLVAAAVILLGSNVPGYPLGYFFFIGLIAGLCAVVSILSARFS